MKVEGILGNTTMFAKQIKPRCEKAWTLHGWKVCQSCGRSFGRHGAKFSLTGTPGPHMLIDMDAIPCLKGLTLCDYIFISGNLEGNVEWVVPVELASGEGKDPKKAIEQLQAGATLAERSIKKSASINFLPVLVGKIRRLRGARKNVRKFVRFHGKDIPLSVIASGSSFASEMNKKLERDQQKC